MINVHDENNADVVFSFVIVQQTVMKFFKTDYYYNSLIVAVIAILRMRFAGARNATIAASKTKRRMIKNDPSGNCQIAYGKCLAMRKSYSSLLSGRPMMQPTTHPSVA